MSPRTRTEAIRQILAATVGGMVAAGSMGACAGPPEKPEPRHLIGCHYFGQDSVFHQLQLPWGIRLMDRPLEGWPAMQQREGVRRATTLTGVDEVDVPFGYWILAAPDSLEIGYPAGGGLRLRLAIHEGRFSGVAEPVGDAMPPPAARAMQAGHPVELTWARCPED